MNRRKFLMLTAPAVAAHRTLSVARADMMRRASGGFGLAREQFIALPGDKSFLIQRGDRPAVPQERHRPDRALFIGSAVKSFILATFLRKMEAGALSESELLPIDDSVRSLSSPIFGAHLDESDNLSGKASARTVLEAMISHSDNTATDAILHRVGIAEVRAFIAAAGLTATRIPDSTRRMFSYLAGANAGVDVGWAGMKKVDAGALFGKARYPVNGRETMISSASELVSFYRRVLRGEFFSKPATLVEFKRIQAMADLIARVVPDGTAAYAKGGSIDWQDFHALCAPGQMIIARQPVSFCFTVNWTGPNKEVPDVTAKFAASVGGMLAAVA